MNRGSFKSVRKRPNAWLVADWLSPSRRAARETLRSSRSACSTTTRFRSANFFDIVDDDIVYEVLYDLGWPRVMRGRTELMKQFRGYCEAVELRAADHLIAHKTDNGRVLVIEYEVHGMFLASGANYDNRFCSIIHVENRKITHWRDYMDSLAAWNALQA
jgi:uncharacterized protein